MDPFIQELINLPIQQIRGLKIQGKIPVPLHIANALIKEFVLSVNKSKTPNGNNELWERFLPYSDIWLTQEGSQNFINMEVEVPNEL